MLTGADGQFGVSASCFHQTVVSTKLRGGHNNFQITVFLITNHEKHVSVRLKRPHIKIATVLK